MRTIQSMTFTAAFVATLVLVGCGTTTMDAMSGQSQSIGHQTAGYSHTEAGTIWNTTAPPSHTTLIDNQLDVISPIQPSVIRLGVNPASADNPLDVFLSSASDYHFESAYFEMAEGGSMVLEVTGFGADRSSVHLAAIVDAQQWITAQVEAGAMTQREAMHVLGAVAEAIAARALPTP